MDHKAQWDRLETKIDKALEHLSSIDVTLAGQHAQLTTHIKRTDLLERELKPISKHVQQMQGVGKFLGLLAVIATIIAGFTALWSR